MQCISHAAGLLRVQQSETFVFTEPHRTSFSEKQSCEKTPVLTQSVVGQALGKHDIAE